MNTPLTAVSLVCSLSASPAASSSELLSNQIAEELQQHDVTTKTFRIADYNIKPGVEVDMGAGDDWPAIRQHILDADILIIATPIWVGHPSSMTQRVIERLDAELSETDDNGQLLTYGKVAVLGVVGNEDGAHKVTADVFQALNDVGFTIPSIGATYWVGEAMHKTDYKDLSETPEMVASTTKSLAAHAAHLAAFLKSNPYPAS